MAGVGAVSVESMGLDGPVGQPDPTADEQSAGPRCGPCVTGGAYVDGVFLDEAELGAREDELAELTAHIDAATHRQLTLIRIMDVSERWGRQGAKSCAHWLSWRIGVELGSAREQVRVARALAPLSKIDDALRRGALSYSKARAMTRVATPANEERLLDIAQSTTAAQLEKVCRGVRQQQREDGRTPSDVLERSVRMRFRGDGTVKVEAVLLADEAHRVMDAVRVVHAAMAEGLSNKPDKADALVRIAEAVLSGDLAVDGSNAIDVRANDPRDVGRPSEVASPSEVAGMREDSDAHVVASAADDSDANERDPRDVASPSEDAGAETTATAKTQTVRRPSRGADRTQLVVHFTQELVEGKLSAQLDDGGNVSAETFRRLACDCALLGVVEGGDGAVIDIGRKSRRIPSALHRAVMLRDRHCQFPGCTHDVYIDLHHVEHWLHGGETRKDNLLALCTFHHRLVHEGGFTLERDDEGAPRFLGPDRQVIPAAPTPPAAPTDPRAAFEQAHAALAIHSETGLTSWDGDPIDYGACVEIICSADDATQRPTPEIHEGVDDDAPIEPTRCGPTRIAEHETPIDTEPRLRDPAPVAEHGTPIDTEPTRRDPARIAEHAAPIEPARGDPDRVAEYEADLALPVSVWLAKHYGRA